MYHTFNITIYIMVPGTLLPVLVFFCFPFFLLLCVVVFVFFAFALSVVRMFLLLCLYFSDFGLYRALHCTSFLLVSLHLWN